MRSSARSYTPLEWAGWLATAKGVLCPDRQADVRVLAAFMEFPGRVFDHAHLLSRIGATTTKPAHRLAATHVRRLRQALADLGFPGCIITHWRTGYSIRPDDAVRILAFIEGFAAPEAQAAE